MLAKIIAIGNSKGIRIPKALLEESGIDIDKEVEIKASKGLLKITPAKRFTARTATTLALSESVLRKDWNKPEEDEAWANL